MQTKISIVLLFAFILLCLGTLLSCNSEQIHIHSFSSEWSYDDTHHWQAAICSDNVECLYVCCDLSEHSLVDDACTVCEYVLVPADGEDEAEDTNTPDEDVNEGNNDTENGSDDENEDTVCNHQLYR